MSDAPRAAILSPGPLGVIALGIRRRLELVFPTNLFQHAYVQPKLTPEVWRELTRRPPFVGLGWEGMQAAHGSMNEVSGPSAWPVFLSTSNPSGVEQQYFGDRLAPGIFDLAGVAAAALHGFSIPKAGTVQVTGIHSLAIEGYNDPSQAAALVELSVVTSISIGATIGNVTPSALDGATIEWSFGGAAALTDQTTGTPA